MQVAANAARTYGIKKVMETHPQADRSHASFEAYQEELRQLFAAHRMHFGDPEDVQGLAEALSAPGSFREEMTSLIRSMILREGGVLSPGDLLGIVTAAIGASNLEESPLPTDPMRQILTFLAGVLRRGWGMSGNEVDVPDPGVGKSAVESSYSQFVAESDLSEAPENSAVNADSSASRLDRTKPADSESPVVEKKVIYPPPRAGYGRLERSQGMESEEVFDVSAPVSENGGARDSGWQALSIAGWSKRRYLYILGLCVPLLAMIAAVLLLQTRPSAPAINEGNSAAIVAPVEPDVSAASKPRAGGLPIGGIARESTSRSDKPVRNNPEAAQKAMGTGLASASNAAEALSKPIDLSGVPTQDPAPIHRVTPPAFPISPSEEQLDRSAAAGEPYRGGVHSHPPSKGTKSRTSALIVSSGVMAGNLISSPPPEYPKFASFAHIEGQVILQAVVSRNGTVTAIHVLSGHHLLRGAAIAAVRRWRYRPYFLNGKPTDVATIVTVNFHLRH